MKKAFIGLNLLLTVTFTQAQKFGQVQKLVASDRTAVDLLGTSVAITSVYGHGDGSYVLVGAAGDADFGTKVAGSGTPYFFSNLSGTWGMINKLGALGGTFFDRNEGAAFGYSVS